MSTKILIVDDSPISRKILRQCIGSPEDYEFHEAGDGAAGVEQYKALRPEVTFLDLTMPVNDGIQALQEIRELDPGAVVIVATADVQVKTLFRVMSLGALSVVRKPLTKESVQAALAEALGQRSRPS
jgi:two-component system chemotaxis response regulator CheY